MIQAISFSYHCPNDGEDLVFIITRWSYWPDFNDLRLVISANDD
jgi:hypothetical protein